MSTPYSDIVFQTGSCSRRVDIVLGFAGGLLTADELRQKIFELDTRMHTWATARHYGRMIRSHPLTLSDSRLKIVAGAQR